MKNLLRSLLLVACLAACTGGATESGSQVGAGVSEDEEAAAYSGFTASDTAAMRPETERSRAVLWRLKGSTMQHQLRN